MDFDPDCLDFDPNGLDFDPDDLDFLDLKDFDPVGFASSSKSSFSSNKIQILKVSNSESKNYIGSQKCKYVLIL